MDLALQAVYKGTCKGKWGFGKGQNWNEKGGKSGKDGGKNSWQKGSGREEEGEKRVAKEIPEHVGRAVRQDTLQLGAEKEETKICVVHVLCRAHSASALIRDLSKPQLDASKGSRQRAARGSESATDADSATWARSRHTGGILTKLFHGFHHWHYRTGEGFQGSPSGGFKKPTQRNRTGCATTTNRMKAFTT